MSKSTRNSGKSWSAADKASLRSLAKGNTPTRVIGLKLGRTPGAVQTQASKRAYWVLVPRAGPLLLSPSVEHAGLQEPQDAPKACRVVAGGGIQ